MQKFFPVFKNKKYYFFIFLFFIVFLVLIFPKITIAVNGGAAMQVPSTTTTATVDTRTDLEKSESCPNEDFPWYKDIVAFIVDIIVWLPKKLAIMAGDLASKVIGEILKWPITNTSTKDGAAGAFAAGWKTTRDLANMFIVLGFVIVGIATTLRIREYEAKKALWPLIIVALLVNFSVLFVGLMLDAATVTITYFTQGTNARMGIQFMNGVRGAAAAAICARADAGDLSGYMAMSFQFLFIYWVVAFTFIYLSFILIARYAILGILFMLSPLAFVFWAFPFPKAKDLWNKWWGAFLKWTFIGVEISFFLWIASTMLDNFTKTVSIKGMDPSDMFFYILVVTITIVVGIMISIKSSGAVGAAAKGLVTGGAGFAIGALAGGAGAGAKMLDKATGGRASAAGRSLKSGVGSGMERLGLRQTGSTATANSKQVEDKATTMSKEYAAAKATGNTGSMARIQALARNGRGAEGAAAYKVISDAKDLHKAFADSSKPGGVNLEKAASRASYAAASGATDVIKNSEKVMPELAGYNQPKLKEIKAKNPAWSDKQVRREAVREKNAGMSISDMRSMPSKQINAAHLEDVNFKTYARASLDYNTDQRAAAKGNLPELKDRRNITMGFAGATAADRKAEYKAYRKLTPANRTAYKATLTADERGKMDDLNRKIAFTKKL